jgi:hypothetical protein
MVGWAPGFAAQTLVAMAAVSVVYRPSAPGASPARRRLDRVLWLALLAGSCVASTAASGVLLGPTPVLLAVGIAGALDGTLARALLDRSGPPYDLGRVAPPLVLGAGLLLGGLVARAVALDAGVYSVWTGGVPRGGTPPTFDRVVSEIFHAFAPWSALLPFALGRMLVPPPIATTHAGGETGMGAPEAVATAEGSGEPPLRLVLLLWASFGYAATTLYESRYGEATYLPVVALAGCVALAIRDLERSGRGSWAAALVSALFSALLLRDLVLYPGAPAEGLPVGELRAPEVFNPRRDWSVVLGIFIVSALLSLGVDAERRPLDLGAPYRLLRAQWRRGTAFKVWLVAIALVVTASVVTSIVFVTWGESLGLPSQALRWSKRLLWVPLALPALVALVQFVLWAVARLGRYRTVPLLVAGLVVGGYVSQRWLPALSAHLSPRDVYDTYNAKAGPNEPLAEYRVGGRAAAYYARGEVRELQAQAQLVDYLAHDGAERRWAAFPADDLPAVNRAFRQRTKRHLFVADARSARVVLAASRSVPGMANQNFLAEHVLDAPPAHIQHRVDASFEDKIELLGYDLELPHGDYVGAGESFTVTWYWRALRNVPGGYKVFVHVDGQGQRLNGDHDPVEDKYPTRLWDEGDIVRDVQRLSVPPNYRSGDYTFFIGLFSGETRMQVVRGPKDDANRVIAGILRVR